MLGDEAQAEGASNIRNQEDEDEETAPVNESVIEVDTDQDADGDQDTVGDLEQRRAQLAEAETLDDQGAEVGDATVGNVAHHSQDKEEVELDVEEGLFYLVPLEVLVLDTSLVAAQALDRHAFLFSAETFRRHGRVGKEDKHDNSPGRAQGADDEKLVLP